MASERPVHLTSKRNCQSFEDTGKDMNNPLSRESIIREAIVLLNDEGLDQFSLRKVAVRLGVKAPSLYWYVSDKADLLSLVAEAIFRDCLASMGPCQNWGEWLVEFGRRLWIAQNSARDLGRLMIAAKYPQERLELLGEDIVTRLLPYDLDAASANSMQSSVQAFVTGWASLIQGPNGEYLRDKIPVEAAFQSGLLALVNGFGCDATKPC